LLGREFFNEYQVSLSRKPFRSANTIERFGDSRPKFIGRSVWPKCHTVATPGKEISANQSSNSHCSAYFSCCWRKRALQQVLFCASRADNPIAGKFQNLPYYRRLGFTSLVNHRVAQTEPLETTFLKNGKIRAAKEKSGRCSHRIPVTAVEVMDAVGQSKFKSCWSMTLFMSFPSIPNLCKQFSQSEESIEQ
jgi:hypothetical protein